MTATCKDIMDYIDFLKARRDRYEALMVSTGKTCWKKRYTETCKEIEYYYKKALEALAK